MIKYLYSVFDRKANSYKDVFCVDNPHDAHRMITNMIFTDRTSVYYNFAGDFCLVCLYKFDSETGLVLDDEDDFLGQYALEFSTVVSHLKDKDKDEQSS